MAIQKFQKCSCSCGWQGPRRIHEAKNGTPAHPAPCPKCGSTPALSPGATVVWRHFFYRDGRQASRTFKTKGAAERHAREVGLRADRGEEIDEERAKMTLAGLADEYMERGSVGENGFSESTKAIYRLHLDCYILPALGRRTVRSLQTDDVLRLYTAMRGNGRGEATVRAVHKLMHALGEHAVDTHCRASTFARLPKNERRRMAARPREVKPPTQEQVAAIAAAVPERFRALVWMLAVAGLRVGKATALRVRDLDFDEGMIRVRANAPEVNGVKYLDQRPKTSSSVRDVPMPTELAGALAQHLNRFGNRFDPDSLVFTNSRGNPVRQSNLRKNIIQPAARRAGIVPAPTVHHLRHFAASYAAGQGLTMVEVASLLGHTTVTMTGLYSHTFADRQRDKVAALGAILRQTAASG